MGCLSCAVNELEVCGGQDMDKPGMKNSDIVKQNQNLHCISTEVHHSQTEIINLTLSIF